MGGRGSVMPGFGAGLVRAYHLVLSLFSAADPRGAARSTSGGFQNSRPEFAGIPSRQGVAAKCSASSAATWSAACSGSQCEAPSSSVKR